MKYFRIAVCVTFLLSIRLAIPEEVRSHLEGFSSLVEGVKKDAPETLAAAWKELTLDEKETILFIATVNGSTQCLRVIFEAGFSAWGFNRDGRLFAFLSKDEQTRAVYKKYAEKRDEREIAISLVQRICRGLSDEGRRLPENLRNLSVEGNLPHAPNGDELIEGNDSFLASDELKIIFTKLSEEKVEFEYRLNWDSLTGRLGYGVFLREGRFWRIEWHGAADG